MTGGPIDVSLMQPAFLGPRASHKPISFYNTLTGEVREFDTPDGVLQGQPFFDFTGWPPAIYNVSNASAGPIPIVLWQKTYIVEAGTFWIFVAHDEIGSHIAWQDTGMATRIIESFWDVDLGGSIWDDGASLWDVFIGGAPIS